MPQRDSWDAVVIGAGPAGSVAACLLARQGLRTALIEKSDFPRYKVCGGCLNERGLASLRAHGLAHLAWRASGATLREVRFARRSRAVSIPGPAGMAIDRAAFDEGLAIAAQEAGACFLPGAKALVEPTCSSASRGVLLYRVGKLVDRLSASLVVVADGLGRPSLERLPQFAAQTLPNSRVGLGIPLDVQLRSDYYAPGALHMAVGDDGYLGITRLADHRFCIAAAVAPATASCGSLGAWMAGVIEQCSLPNIEGLAEASPRGTRPLTQRPAALAAERILLLGDAAGYIEPITGEGMAWALAAAATLPPFAHAAQRDWNPKLEEAWRRELHRRVWRGQIANRMLAATLRHPRWARSLFAVAAAYPPIVAPIARRLNQHRNIDRNAV